MHDFRFDTTFEAQVLRTPGSVALRFHKESVTFGELNARANRVAGALHVAKVPEGAYVGLHVGRSADAVAALLGILKVGAVVVPLPPAWPPNRVEEILKFAQLDLVIDSHTTPVSSEAAPTLHLEDALQGPEASSPGVIRKGEQAAFVICSSGSTGAPKMIVRSHSSFLHRLKWTWQEHPYQTDDVCVQKSFQATTHSIYELFEPLLQGVAVRIVPDEALRDLSAFWDLLTRERVTRLLIVPSMLQASLDLPDFVAPPLRVMVLMGEHVSGPLASRTVAAFPRETKIFSIYGSSEASSTLVSDLREHRPDHDDPPLGRPITPDVTALVLNEQLEPIAPGGTGMLHIAGSPLFIGYFRNTEGTEAALEKRHKPDLLYRTSDHVRVREDGQFVFTGRADNVVKVRGFRVDLGEVERVLSRAPGVRQCVVSPQPDALSAATLVGHVIPTDVHLSDLFDWLRAHLPAYMLPSVIQPMDEFPRTPSGKVDRRRLAAEYRQASDGTLAEYESDTERAVAKVWCALLGLSNIDRNRSFFEMGGTSLTVFAAAHRLREALGLTPEQLGATTIYDFPTLAALARVMDQTRRGETVVSAGGGESVLVALKRGDATLPPLFAVSAAGGTLGAYDKTIKAMKTPREIIGLRDPFISGGRNPVDGFQSWVRQYTDAIRRKQLQGPYYILAYSSAGAFGYEIVQQLRAAGEEIAFFGLVDPVAMDAADSGRFGYWALQGRSESTYKRTLIRLAGTLRALVPHGLRSHHSEQNANDWKLSEPEFDAFARAAKADGENILRLATLMELSTGQPFAIRASELGATSPLDTLKLRVASVDASIDADLIERTLVQYELQVKSQHNYRLQAYDGPVHLYYAEGPESGLIAAQLRPYVQKLHAHALPMSAPTDRTRDLLQLFSGGFRAHFSCMRNDLFAKRLATELDLALERAPRSH